MDRNATIRLTEKDKQSARQATLGVHGSIQADGTL